jgi:hypothetical protein
MKYRSLLGICIILTCGQVPVVFCVLESSWTGKLNWNEILQVLIELEIRLPFQASIQIFFGGGGKGVNLIVKGKSRKIFDTVLSTKSFSFFKF